ncbi:MAG: 3-hydroxyacyl-CoA dehydrogenase NAD-binding domain-containing protein [Gemmatimonadota bacterium]
MLPSPMVEPPFRRSPAESPTEPPGEDSLGDGRLAFSLSVRDEEIAWLEMRPQRGSAVPLTISSMREFSDLITEVELLAVQGRARALIIGTVAPHPRLVGYDLDEIRALSAADFSDWSHEGRRVLRRLEQLPIPSIAAVQGQWLGGAAELALACSYRVGCDVGGARIGFPHVRLGLLPAWGGTVRLPRLVGLRAALELVLTGISLPVEEAREIGLMDGVLASAEFTNQVQRFTLGRLQYGRPQRRRGRPIRRRLLDDTAPGRRLLSSRARRRFLGGQDPEEAQHVALDLISETVALPLSEAFERETETATRLIRSGEAQGRLHSYRYTERARSRLPIGAGEFEAAAVLGAGQTGSDLAHALVSAGTRVRMKDERRALVRKGVERARMRLMWESDQGRITEGQARRRAGRLEGVTGFGGFGTLGLVVGTPELGEGAAVELLAEAETHVRETCLLAFHDWSASPTRVQRVLTRPERVLAMLPALPIDRFRLLEIVPGALTSPEIVSTARRLARRLSMTAVVVTDQTPSPGTRLLGVYFAEAARLLEAGLTVDQVDDAAEAFGFEVGPFRRMDAIGLRRSARMMESLAAAVGGRMQASPTLQRLAREGGTFYRYRENRPVGINTSLPPASASGEPSRPDSPVHLLLLMLMNEAGLIVEEGCTTDPGDLEVISVLGLGFPRERGGLLYHAESVGLTRLVDELHQEARNRGERFQPAGLIRDLAAGGGSFFTREPPRVPGHETGEMLR